MDLAADPGARRDDSLGRLHGDSLVTPPECGGGFSLGYDPYDFRSFASAHGDERQLRMLLSAAHKAGLQVYADMVLNHMCGNNYTYPRFNKSHFHTSGAIGDWNDQWQLENGSLFGLEDLKQESPYVRGELWNYLVKTNDLGFDGYRWDAAKHIPQWFWRDHILANTRKWGKYSFGEVYNGNVAYLVSYAALGMSVTDYPLYFQIRDSFKLGGNLATLDGAGLAAHDGPHAVTFVENHDVAPPANRLLAYAFISAYPGYPMFFRVDLRDRAINNLVWVQNNLASGPYVNAYKSENALVFFRGERLLAGINQGGDSLRQRITTPWRNARLHDYTGHVADARTDANGAFELLVPATSYVMFALAS
jgi:alpha-amylase